MTGRELKLGLLVVIALFGVWFLRAFLAGLRRVARGPSGPGAPPAARPSAAELGTGFITVFFDTFGIGSFATTTAIFRARRLVPDELIPGTLNVGHTPSAVLSAFVFIGLVPVAAGTLLPMIAAAGLGAWLGSGIVARLARYRVRLGMGTALLVAACVMLLTQLGRLPGGGDALALHGARWAVAVLGNFVLGGLMTLGIGLYAPCMILISLLGMNPLAAFPIMMGSCAFLMTISGVRFLREERYHPSAALALTLGGIPALLIAAYAVKSLPVGAVRWVVIVVVLYTGLTLLDAGRRELKAAPAPRVRPA
ncbi:MAG TPA: sulfite exporter TauE/SafE family protein [Gemmatimonadaceae bacterium]|nr:sulfite exporter TauE/SafE family protein [Gemmatimonadaceae bacterium]